MSVCRQSPTDRAWIARIQAGDADALDALFRSYYRTENRLLESAMP
jgi:hypothetical protein